MVQLTEVTDEEFMREQEGPVDDEDWDTDSGTTPQSCLFTNPVYPLRTHSQQLLTMAKPQIPILRPSTRCSPMRHFSSAFQRCKI